MPSASSFPTTPAPRLQLANFWQDVSVDYAKGRIYLPLEDLRRYSVSEEDIEHNRNTPAFCEMMKFEVERARQWFDRGLPLVSKVDRELAVDLELFSRGGQEILNAIERQNFAVLGRRPVISKTRKLASGGAALRCGEVAGGSQYECGSAAGVDSVESGSGAAHHGLFRVPRHHPHQRQEFLLRISGAAQAQEPGALRRLRLHAPLR